MKLKEQDFAQRRWKALILESSHCLGFLPFVSCYISSKTASTKISVKTCKGILKHTYPSLHRLSSFLLVSSSAFTLLKGTRWWSAARTSQWGRFQSFVFAAVCLWRDLGFMPAVYIVSVSFSFPFALPICLVCFAMSVGM